jgi:hypothetical protein
MFNKVKIGKLGAAHCSLCKHWYDIRTMVVIDYQLPTEQYVCVPCYEDKIFIPPEPLMKGDKHVGDC